MNRQEKMIFEIAQKVNALGGRAYYVGGCVRDKLMKIECLDKDIEIHGIEMEQLRTLLRSCTDNLIENLHFGVFTLPDYEIDVALPRSEILCGRTHKDFEVSIHPHLDARQATVRRDFTINAMMEDVLTGELVPNKIFQSFARFVLGGLVKITNVLNQLSKSFLDRPYLRCSQTSHHLSQAVPRDLQRNAKSYPRWLDTLCHQQSRANEPYLQSDSY